MKFEFHDRVKTNDGGMEGLIVGTCHTNQHTPIYIVLLNKPVINEAFGKDLGFFLKEFQAVQIPEPFLVLIPNSVKLIQDLEDES